MNQVSIFFYLVTGLISCTSNDKNIPILKTDTIIEKERHVDTLSIKNKVSSLDYSFFSDSILHGHKEELKYYFKKYGSDSTCSSFWHFYDKEEIRSEFEGLAYIGDINHNAIKDSVFVLEPLNYCKHDGEKDFDGEAYYFTDTTLPRLQTGSSCCHPSNLFLVGDINEDGISEIGQFFSSCASHYKSLYVYSLKNGKWNQVGHSCFDLFYMDVNKPLSSWVKKTSKNKFEMLQITDLTEKSKIGKKDWLKFEVY